MRIKTGTTQIYIDRIQRSLEYICQHLDQSVSLETLAKIACFSPFHFHRIFRGLTGETVADLTRRIRLEYAYYMLMQQKLDVTEATFEVGYENVESFSRAFKKHFTLTHQSNHRKSNGRFSNPCFLCCPVEFSPLKLELQPIIGETTMKVRIEEIKEHPIAYIRHIGPYHEVGDTYKQLFAWAGSNGLLHPMPNMYGFSWDDPTVVPAHQLRFDAAISMPKDTNLKKEKLVQIIKFPAGLWAITRHQGSYKQIGEIFQEMMGTWVPTSGYMPDDKRPCLEIYLNTPMSTPEPELLTDICIPIQKISLKNKF
ncbi:MAG: AraC family transcriptional regulator [Rhodospirillaceae bacterium]|nr:AraC family transcriptional regulator [Rhodospirillaceae bacterium]